VAAFSEGTRMAVRCQRSLQASNGLTKVLIHARSEGADVSTLRRMTEALLTEC
jgi:hypothetical protein